jgi:hypothetical protein
MAISSLNRFTVPIPGGQSATNQGLLMPKLKYRFRVLLENFGVSKPTTELTKQVMKVSRPKVTFQNIEIFAYNSKINYAGRYTWETITLSTRDDVTGAVSRLVGEQIQKQFDFFEQSSASSGIDYKFTTKIEMLDGGNGANEPRILEVFELYGCYLADAAYSDADYADTGTPADIIMTIRYDNAIQLNEAGIRTGIGASVGRGLRTLITG